MKSKGLIVYERMRQMAEVLLGKELVKEIHHKNQEGFHYEFSSEKGEVHFADEKRLSAVEAHYKEKHGEIKSIQVSENIFCNHCRYIYYNNKDPKYKEMNGRVRHYTYENYDWEELVARLKTIDIIDNLKYGAYPVLKPENIEKEKGLMNKPILEYMKGNTKELHRLFELVGYSKEEMHSSWEPASVYFSIATRLLYDDDYQVNLIGRGVINCLIRHIE